MQFLGILDFIGLPENYCQLLYVDLVYDGLSSCHVLSCLVLSCLVMSCLVMSCHASCGIGGSTITRHHMSSSDISSIFESNETLIPRCCGHV